MKKILDAIKIMLIILGIIFVLFILFIIFCFNKGYIKRNADEPIATESISVSQTNPPTVEPTVEPTKTPTKKPTKKPTQKPTKTPSELSEKEYKALCKEVYYDDFFSDSPNVAVGDYVKFYGFISGKAEYYYSDTFAMVIDDIDKIYTFRKEYMGSCVMHKETKNDELPSYFGKSVYLMFPETSDLHIENYEAGQYFVIYGQIVQTWSGIFIIPKYIENN